MILKFWLVLKLSKWDCQDQKPHSRSICPCSSTMRLRAWQGPPAPGSLPFPLGHFTEALNTSTSPNCSFLAFSFPGKSGCQWQSSFKETCHKGKFQFPPLNICPSTKLCNASRFHFYWMQLLYTNHSFIIYDNTTTQRKRRITKLT